MDNPLEFTHANVMKLQVISEKLNDIYVANSKWQYQWTVDSSFKST